MSEYLGEIRYTVLALSVLLSVINIYCHTFLSNHASQSLQIWYCALARGPMCRLPNSGPPVIYFLFPSPVHCWTVHLGIAGVYLVSKNSQISCSTLCCSFNFREACCSNFLYLLQLLEAGLRELKEETGLTVTPEMCCDNNLDIMAMWEVTSTLYHTIPLVTALKKRPFENIVGKGENAGNQHFLLFPQFFHPSQKEFLCFLVTFKLLSANAFNLDQSKILVFGKGLTHYQTTKF